MDKLIGGTITGAYGRDYKSSKEMEKYFRNGYDFKVHLPYGSTYCSIRDFEPGCKIQIRWNKMTEVDIITV